VEVGSRDVGAEIEAVYRRRYGKFLRVAVAILRDEQLAEETVHDAFVRALRHRGGFSERGVLEAWLWRIVVNEARRRRSIELRAPLLPIATGARPPASAATTNGHRESGALEAIQMVARDAADFTTSRASRDGTAFKQGRQPIPREQAATVLGRTPLWLGASYDGLPLAQVYRETTSIGHQQRVRLTGAKAAAAIKCSQ
jgi:DNA-directed RNA polymerase specialized sigma24 family protein